MKGITALNKIRARTKQLQRKHPGKKYSTLQKQASSEYKSGRIPKKRAAHKPKKRRKVTGTRKYKVSHRVKTVGAVKTVRKSHKRRKAPKRRVLTVVRVRTRTVTKARRVGGGGSKSMLPMLLGIAVVGVGAYLLMRKSTPTTPVPLVTTPNVARNTAAANLVQVATSAGASITALTNLIKTLNSMSDSQVVAAQQQVATGGIAPANIADAFNPNAVSTINDEYDYL